MNWSFFLYFALAFNLNATIDAQAPDDEANIDFSIFYTETTQHTLIENTPVYQSPSSDSKVISKLPILSPVEITAIENDSDEAVNEHTAPWYQVKFEQNGKSQTAYIWGGHLAEKVKYAKDGTAFVYGVNQRIKKKIVVEDSEPGYEEEVVEILSIQLKMLAVRNGKVINQLNFETPSSYPSEHYFNLNNNKGVDGLKNVLQVGFKEYGCMGQNGDVYIAWDGQKLTYIEATSQENLSPFYANLYFPNDENGKKGKIIYVEGGEVETEDGEYRNEEEIIGEYAWKNNKLVQLK